MYNDGRKPGDGQRRLHYANTSVPGGIIGRTLAFIGTVIVAGLALMFSVVLFALVIAGGIIVWGYLWWKTRELRKRMKEQMSYGQPGYRPPPGGVILEGEVIREVRPEDASDKPPR